MEFQRKCRGLKELDRWKEAEFSFFFFMLVQFFFRGCSEPSFITIFLYSVWLHLCLWSRHSRAWSNMHSSFFTSLLRGCRPSKGLLVYNMHCLVHLENEARRFEALDNSSSFLFENYLHRIKRCIKSGNKPLQLLHRRSFEKVACENSCPRPANFRTLGPRVVSSSRPSNSLGFSGCDETLKKVIMNDCT